MKTETRTTRRKPSKAKAKAQRDKAAVKRSTKAAKTKKVNRKGKGRKSANGHTGGGKALSDFGNTAKLRVLKPKEIPARSACFKTGETVSACLTAQKAKGFRGRRKFIRAQITQGRVSLR